MTTNGNDDIPADTEMAECDDGGNVVTMMDVLREQQDFEDDANAVLGASDEKECTYSQGNIKRQAIYACLTCCPESKEDPTKRAGVCLACSLSCHENHDLVELYTKRNFKCDCGNSKFNSSCQFTLKKPDLNEDNIYNQNFIGLYCICSKPYDPDCDEMIQCVICEDWLHTSHLDALLPAHNQFVEMICKLCMTKNEFIHDYSEFALNSESGDADNNDGVDSSITVDNLTNGNSGEELTGDADNDDGVDSHITVDNLTNGNSEEKLTGDADNDDGVDSSSITVDNLANGNSEEKLTNSSVTTEILTKIGDESMETCMVDNIAEFSNDDTNSLQEESTDQNNISKETVDEESINKPINALMETETNNDTELLPEVGENNMEIASIDKYEDKSESNYASEEPGTTDGNLVESYPTFEKKLDEYNTSSEKTCAPTPTSEDKSDEPCPTSEEKSDETSPSSKEKTEDQVKPEATPGSSEPSEVQITNDNKPSAMSNEDISETSQDNDGTASDSETVTENSKVTVNFEQDSNETKMTEDKPKTITEIVQDDEDLSKVTNFNVNCESPTDETKATSPVKEINESNATSLDEEMNDSKVTENVPVDYVAGNTNVEESAENKFDSKTEPETKVPELVSTENKRKMTIEDMNDDTENDMAAKKPKIDICIRPKGVKKVHKGATFWPATFRQKLCKCNECITMYKDLSVLFLIDPEDMVLAYETLSKERTAGNPNQYEKGMQALCSLGRIQQIDALTEYNKMRDKLLIFLQGFKDKKEVVTEQDIKTFFAGMKPEKRNDGVYFCR